MHAPKAKSVSTTGDLDGFEAPRGWRAEEAPDGSTRILVHVPSGELRDRHIALLRTLQGPLAMRYVRLTDRATGQLAKPESYVHAEVPTQDLIDTLCAREALVWYDGRHQTWVRGVMGEQVVLDELGVLYCYPDDPTFRDALADLPFPAAG